MNLDTQQQFNQSQNRPFPLLFLFSFSYVMSVISLDIYIAFANFWSCRLVLLTLYHKFVLSNHGSLGIFLQSRNTLKNISPWPNSYLPWQKVALPTRANSYICVLMTTRYPMPILLLYVCFANSCPLVIFCLPWTILC